MVSPDFQNVTAGQSTSFLAAVDPVRGFNGTVVLSTSGLPSGASASFSPASLASGTSVLTLNTSSGTPGGTYTINVLGTSGSLQHTTPIILVVKANHNRHSFRPRDPRVRWDGHCGSHGLHQRCFHNY